MWLSQVICISRHASHRVDYKKSQDARDRCPFCSRDNRGPRVQVIAEGTRCYLAFPEAVDMVPGHCLIVPNEHVLTLLG